MKVMRVSEQFFTGVCKNCDNLAGYMREHDRPGIYSPYLVQCTEKDKCWHTPTQQTYRDLCMLGCILAKSYEAQDVRVVKESGKGNHETSL